MRRPWPLLAVASLSLTLAPAAYATSAPAAAAAKPAQASVMTVHLTAPRDGFPPVDPLTPRIYLPYSQTKKPPGFVLNARDARRVAERTSAVRDARAHHPDLEQTTYLSPLKIPAGAFWHWDIIYEAGGKQLVEVEIHPITGDVLQVTRAPDIGWPLLLGDSGVLGGKLNAPYVWLPLCLLFLMPFFDPRRPFRLLHLDLLVLLGFGVSQIFFNAGNPDVSVPLVYPPLVYCVVRGALAGFRPRRRDGPLAPHVTTRFLAIGLAVLVALRIAFAVAGSSTFDVSTAGVIGADRIEHGLALYVDNDAHGDTYAPVNYLMYVPAELAFPFRTPNHVTLDAPAADAARAATLMFDVLMLLGLFLVGRSLRPGPAGRRMGLALAWAWAAFPYSALVIASTTNDALIALFVVYALLALRSPPGRGALAALATLTKFAPALVAPLLMTGRGPFRPRAFAIAALAWTVVVVGVFLPFIPDGGLRELWNTTLGFQLHRTSPLSLWVRDPSLGWLRTLFSVLAAGLAVTAAFLPRRRSTGQLAALVAAIFAASQIPANYWLYFYVVWFAPFLFIALFEEYRELGPAGQPSVTSDFVKPEMISQPESVTATRSSIRTPSLPGT